MNSVNRYNSSGRENLHKWSKLAPRLHGNNSRHDNRNATQILQNAQLTNFESTASLSFRAQILLAIDLLKAFFVVKNSFFLCVKIKIFVEK
jgi:hypothetical protein